MTMTDRQHLADIIADISRSKQGRQPDHATMREIADAVLDDMRRTLRSMVKDGTLRCCRTLNDVAFTLPGGRQDTS